LSNLLSNAAKYSPEQTPVLVCVEARNGHALVSVVDQGIGIPKSQVQKVFDPFYRADNLGRNDPGGMGLGLYICQDIVHRHHGRIWAESGDGAGTTIFVELPLDMTKPGISGLAAVQC
jgi:signal transduction histidine kinase